MKITPELLERYQLGQGTPEENKAVEQWVDATEYEPEDVSREVTAEMARAIWGSLEGKINVGGSKVFLYKQLSRYAAAACVAIGIFSLGYFQSSSSFQSEPQTAYNEEKPAADELLYLSSYPGTAMKIAADRLELEFDGVLRIFNNSTELKEVSCGGEMLFIPPGQVSYILNTKTQGLRKMDIKSGDRLFYDENIKKSSLRICV